jgi:hypothetical protein
MPQVKKKKYPVLRSRSRKELHDFVEPEFQRDAAPSSNFTFNIGGTSKMSKTASQNLKKNCENLFKIIFNIFLLRLLAG